MRVSFTERSDGQGYVVRIHTEGRINAYHEPEQRDGRLELLLFNATLGRGYQNDDPQGPVESYSVQPRGGHLLFQFQLDASRPVEAAAYRDRGSHDLLLALTYGAGEVPVAATQPVPSGASVGGAPGLATGPKAADRERWRIDTIVIDAGHGGKDAGARGANRLREKDITLAVALKLGSYLEEKLGVRVVYTRKDDRFISLSDRGHKANEAGGKLFVSIHVNAARSRAAQGTETYFLGMHKSEAARRVMDRENSVIQLESNPDGYKALDENALILQTLTSSAYMRQSEQLAGLIEDQFASRVGRSSRGVKQAGFYVLWGASMPAVLVELGFITNAREAAFLKSEDGQAYMASAIFRAVRDFKQQYEQGLEYAVSK